MRKTNTQKLGDAIKEMLRLNGIDEKIDEHLLIIYFRGHFRFNSLQS